jgi:hypothetical protein
MSLEGNIEARCSAHFSPRILMLGATRIGASKGTSVEEWPSRPMVPGSCAGRSGFSADNKNVKG